MGTYTTQLVQTHLGSPGVQVMAWSAFLPLSSHQLKYTVVGMSLSVDLMGNYAKEKCGQSPCFGDSFSAAWLLSLLAESLG